MNTRRIVSGIVVAVMMSTGSVAGARERGRWSRQEMNVGLDLFAPSESVDWEIASGVDFEIRFWHTRHIGVAMGAGIQWWGAPDEFSEDGDEYFYSSTEVDGSATLVPIGAELLYRSSASGPVRVICSAGVRYALVDSRVNAYTYYEDYYGAVAFDDTIDIDDTVLLTAGATLQCEIDEGVAFDIGIKVQKDIHEPKQTFDGEDIGETNFDAVALTLGFTWEF